MGAVDTPESGGSAGHHKKKRKGKRIGVRIDMTPMVDVAFLLLTFFMLTSVFSRPQAMEINLPESDVPININENNVLTLRGADDGFVYWNVGPPTSVERVSYEELNAILRRENGRNENLVTIIKVEREGTYTMAVDLLDELQLAGVTRFSIAPLTSADSLLVVQAQAGGPAPAGE